MARKCVGILLKQLEGKGDRKEQIVLETGIVHGDTVKKIGG